jgi:hypothetical protein
MVIISILDQSDQTNNLGCVKMKIKCFRFECSQCGEVASIQVFYRKDGNVGYARARHKNSQGFFYHPLPKEYVIEKLGALGSLDQGQPINSTIIDQNNLKLSSESGLVAGRVRFELTTSSLEGWLAIRAATSAQQLERKIGV